MTDSASEGAGREAEAEAIRKLERTRLQALLQPDLEICRELHAPDFHLVTPNGSSLSKEQYLGAVASGDLRYLRWNPGGMEVRLHAGVALIRYQAELEVIAAGRRSPIFRCWHTDSYEKRGRRWQVVWSQATEIA